MKNSMPTIPTHNAPRKNFEKGLRLLGDLLFFTALLTVPLAMHPGLYHPYTALKLSLLYILTLLLLPVMGLLLLKDRRLLRELWNPLVLFLAAWALVHLVSALFSDFTVFALRESAFPLCCVIFCIWAFHRGDKKRIIGASAGLLALAALLTALYGFAQYTGRDFIALEEPGKPVAFMGNANFTSQFLIVILPLLLCFAITGPGRIFYFITIVLIFIQILLLKSRGGIVGCVGGLALFAWGYHYLRKREKGKGEKRKAFIRLDPWIVIILVLGILITGATFLYLDQGELMGELFTTVGVAPESNRYRLLAWSASINLAKDYPVLGAGPGNFRFLHPLYSSEEFWRLRGLFSRVRHIRAHNDYLNILCELGFIGLGIFLGMIVYMGAAFRRFLGGKSRDFQEKILCLALSAGIFATLIQSLFDFNLYNPASGLLFWVLLGFLAKSVLEKKKSTTPLPPFLPIGTGITVLVISVSAFFIFLPKIVISLQTEHLLEEGRISFEAGRFNQSAGMASRALKREPDNIDAVALLADSLRNLPGREKEAVRAYQTWAMLEPNYVPVYNRMGETFYRLGNLEAAQKSFEKALSINQVSVPVLLNLGSLALVSNHPAEAVAYYERAAIIGGNLVQQNQAQYGMALVKLKRYAEAIGHLERSLETQTVKAPYLLELLGDCYVATGQREQAMNKYKQALLFGPKEDLVKKINRLKKIPSPP